MNEAGPNPDLSCLLVPIAPMPPRVSVRLEKGSHPTLVLSELLPARAAGPFAARSACAAGQWADSGREVVDSFAAAAAEKPWELGHRPSGEDEEAVAVADSD